MASVAAAWQNQRVQLAPVQSATVLKMLKSNVILAYQVDFPEEFVQALTKDELREAASLQWVRIYLKTGKLAEMEAPFGEKYNHWRCIIPKVIKLLLPAPIDLHLAFLDRPRLEQMLIVTKLDILLGMILLGPYREPFFATCFYELPEELLVSMHEFIMLIDPIKRLPAEKRFAQIELEAAYIVNGLGLRFKSERADSKEDD